MLDEGGDARGRRALQRGRDALQKLQRAYATAGVLLLPGKAPAPPMLGQADVTVRGELVGRVLAGNLDQSAARQLAVRAKEPSDRVGFLVNERFMTGAGAIAAPSRPKFGKASDLASYRVVAVPIPGRDRSAGLVALKPQSEISAAATRARWEVVLVGLGVIASLLFIAYAVAPAVARSRFSTKASE